MKSRITIAVDFENGNRPVIQILFRQSEDIRDDLVQSFYHALGHQSSWCRVEFRQSGDDREGIYHRILLTPVTPEEIPEQARLMAALAATTADVNSKSPHIFLVDGFPRRNRIDLYEPAEKSIHSAVEYVENMGADVRLTDAIILLQKAKDKVADYIDEQLLYKK